MTSTIDYDGTLISETTLPAFVQLATDEGGVRSLSVCIDMTSLGGDDWTYDTVIGVGDGQVTLLFFDEETT
jgi:hypothetical protein